MDILAVSESGRFPLSRDLLYLSFVLLGFGVACLLHSFRAQLKRKVCSRFITLFIIDLAATLAVFTAACVFSQLQLLSEEYRRIYIVGGGLLVLALLAVRFPKYAAFPLIIPGGILCIWVGYSFLQFLFQEDKRIKLSSPRQQELFDSLNIQQRKDFLKALVKTPVSVLPKPLVSV
ncbi:hypothetical protein ACYULU_03735 [Breznakiellaceae bacterium SP9]